MKFYVYIIYSQTKNRYYIGFTHDLTGRLEKHNLGATISTRSGRPWILVYNEEFRNKSSAMKREVEIKKMKSRKYILSLIKSHSVGLVPQERDEDPRKSNSAFSGKDFRD